MKCLLVVLLGWWACLTSVADPAPQPLSTPDGPGILQLLKKEHPRLLVTPADFVRMRQLLKTDPLFKGWHEQVRAEARALLGQPPSKYEIPDGRRLLGVSRTVLRRVYTLALVERLEGGSEYRERLWRELEAAAGFPDWNPRHFLDTAEMTHAFAIAYDWLHEAWTPAQRAALRRAMLEKGLGPALEDYRRSPKPGWWTKSRHNWNQVCNGGIGMGALALAGDEPALCGEFLARALVSLQLPMAEFAPDGAWGEGPSYWNYATMYNIVFLAALESALGTDFQLSSLPGFDRTGLFPLYAEGPTGRAYNYADGGDHGIHAAQLFWLARRFQLPVCAWKERSQLQPTPLDLVWYQPEGAGPKAAGLPLHRLFRKSEVAFFRSAWEDPQALFVGFKAGDNKVNHSHLDLGSFILEARGRRWVVDLGADNYNLPGYFGDKRWNYYRLRAEGHNTLVLNPGQGPDQNPSAGTVITRFVDQPDRAFAIADLTPAYAAHARKVQRGLAVLDSRAVLVQDEVQASKPAELWWFLHTHASIRLSQGGREAELNDGGERLTVRLLAPSQGTFSVQEAKPLATSPHPEKQAAPRGRKLAVHLRNVSDLRLAVLLVPGEPTGRLPEIKPLAEW